MPGQVSPTRAHDITLSHSFLPFMGPISYFEQFWSLKIFAHGFLGLGLIILLAKMSLASSFFDSNAKYKSAINFFT